MVYRIIDSMIIRLLIYGQKEEFHRGKYEIRCKISKGKGLWPAFWGFGGSVWCELDIFEIYFDDDYSNSFRYTNNVHYDLNNDGGTKGEQCSYSQQGLDFENWHTFTCYFDNDKIDFYIDGNFINRKTRYTSLSSSPLYCGDGEIAAAGAWDLKGWPRESMHIILNMAIQKGENAPNSSTIFPATYEIDYVRFWKRSEQCNNDIVLFNPFNGYRKGDNAILLSGAQVNSGQSATIEVRNNVSLLSSFHAKSGSNLHVKVNPSVCNFGKKSNDEAIDTIVHELELKENIIADSYLNLGAEPESDDISTDKIELQGDLRVNIYPNPNNGQFNIYLGKTNQNTLIEVYDIMGKNIFTKNNVNNQLTIDINNQPKGIYFVKITIGNEVFNEKIVYQ